MWGYKLPLTVAFLFSGEFLYIHFKTSATLSIGIVSPLVAIKTKLPSNTIGVKDIV